MAQEGPPRPPKVLRKVRAGNLGSFRTTGDDDRFIPGDIDLNLRGHVGACISLSHINRFLRSIAIHDPLLWARYGGLGLLPDEFATLIGRTGACNLDITLHGSSHRSDFACVLDYLIEHESVAHRVSSLSIREHRSNAVAKTWLPKLRQCTLPALKTLVVCGNDVDASYSVHQDFLPLGCGSIKLTHATFTNVHIIPCNVPALQELILVSNRKQRSFLHSWPLYFNALLPILEEHKDGLKNLTLDHAFYIPLNDEAKAKWAGRIPLSALDTLYFSDRSTQIVPGFTWNYTYPKGDVRNLLGHISYGSKTYIHLKLFYDTIEAMRYFVHISKCLSSAGTPTVYGARLHMISTHTWSIRYYVKPETASRLQNEDTMEFDNLFRSPSAFCPCEIKVWRNSNISVPSAAEIFLCAAFQISALELASDSESHLEAFQNLLPAHATLRWVFAPVEDIEAIAEFPYAEDDGADTGESSDSDDNTSNEEF